MFDHEMHLCFFLAFKNVSLSASMFFFLTDLKPWPVKYLRCKHINNMHIFIKGHSFFCNNGTSYDTALVVFTAPGVSSGKHNYITSL